MLYGQVGIDPEIMSGTPVFAGTRVPVQNLFDYLEGGEYLNEFLDDFLQYRNMPLLKFLRWQKNI